MDGVGDFTGGISEWSDEVAVAPEFVGTRALFINEGDAWVDMGDVSEPGFPDKRGELDLEPEHLSWEHRCDLVTAGATHREIGRSELGEIGGVGEESPRRGSGDGEYLSLMEGVNAHEKPTNGGRLWFGFRG